MFWIIRWTDGRGEDQSIVVEAKTRVVAETVALKRDIPFVVIEEASEGDVAEARASKRLWRQTHEAPQQTCFGRPVGTRQVACLMLCGLWTIGLLLQVNGVLPTFMFLPM